MLTRDNMSGLYVLIITPFDKNDSLDEAHLRDNVRLLLSLGVDGIITNGANGEIYGTTDEERARIARIVVEETRGKAMAVIGASGASTAESLARSRAARDAGADGVLNMLPFFHVLSKEEAYQYFEDLYKACPDLGVVVYNNRTVTQVLLDDDDFVRLEQVPNTCGSKLVGADLFLFMNCLRRTKLRHFPLEPLWGISHAVGGSGVMASLIYAFPYYMMRWWKSIKTNDLPKALEMQQEVNSFCQETLAPLVKIEGYNEISATKAIVDAGGFLHAGAPRKPFRAVPPERIQKLGKDIRAKFPQFLDTSTD